MEQNNDFMWNYILEKKTSIKNMHIFSKQGKFNIFIILIISINI